MALERINKTDAKTLLDCLLNIEKQKDCYLRNVFQSNLKVIKENEISYLMRFTDFLHNFSDFKRDLLNIILNEKEDGLFDLQFFKEEINCLNGIITDTKCISKYGIKINNIILSWMHDLIRMSQNIDLLLTESVATDINRTVGKKNTWQEN